jgi:hypothetical protein
MNKMAFSQRAMRIMAARSKWIFVCVVTLASFGCAPTPHIYTMEPSVLETIRADISTVGVSMSPERPKTKVLLPAKGAWGGLKRGIVVGATLPVMVGFASPLPGGTFLGLLVSPFGALVGGIYGIYTAVPAEEVEHAEVMLSLAAEKVRNQGLRKDLINAVVHLGNRHTPLRFVAWPETDACGVVQPLPASEVRIDARLTMRAERAGLRGIYHVDPPTDTFIQLHVQLVGLRNDDILLDERFICASDEERNFSDWADQGGIGFIDEFRDCAPELAAKIVDDFFRVYPLRWREGVAF